MQKTVQFLQYFWLTIAIISLGMALYHIFSERVEDALFFFFFTAMAMLLFYVRKRQLKRLRAMSK